MLKFSNEKKISIKKLENKNNWDTDESQRKHGADPQSNFDLKLKDSRQKK